MDHVDPADLALVTGWARGLAGPVLDVGCGPGQWTAHLAGLGFDVNGIDPTPEFIAIARASDSAAPDCTARYRLGSAHDLGVEDGSLGGILSWYSLIHLEPGLISTALAEFACCLRPGGGLALGFFTGETVASFDHAVATAYRWPVDLLVEAVDAAGLTVTHTERRPVRTARDHAAILAVRRA
ncbi:class I SAM-dependent methyltransferase [Gordonia iterans]